MCFPLLDTIFYNVGTPKLNKGHNLFCIEGLILISVSKNSYIFDISILEPPRMYIPYYWFCVFNLFKLYLISNLSYVDYLCIHGIIFF